MAGEDEVNMSERERKLILNVKPIGEQSIREVRGKITDPDFPHKDLLPQYRDRESQLVDQAKKLGLFGDLEEATIDALENTTDLSEAARTLRRGLGALDSRADYKENPELRGIVRMAGEAEALTMERD